MNHGPKRSGSPAVILAHIVCCGGIVLVATGALSGLGAWLLRLLAITAFFQVACYGWLWFRAKSFTQIIDFTGYLLSLDPVDFTTLSMPKPPIAALIGMAFLFAWDVLIERTGDVRFYAGWPMLARASLYGFMVYLLAFGATTVPSVFIYFQF